MRVAIGGSDWAEITPVSELRRADRKAVNATIIFEQDTETGRPVLRASMDDDMATAIMCRAVTDWSLPFPPPVADPASLDKLSLEQDDELRQAIQPHLDAIRGKNAPGQENAVPTPASVS